MVNGLGFASLHEHLLQLGSTAVQTPGLAARVQMALASGMLGHDKGSPAKVIELMAETYASGLAGTMVVVALLVGLLGAISLLLLVIGHQQQQADQ